MEIDKSYTAISKVNVPLSPCTSSTKKDTSSEKQKILQDDKYPKLSIGVFFEFIKTAYQINESSEGLTTTLAANSKVDWNKLAKIDLDFKVCTVTADTPKKGVARETKSVEVIEDKFLEACNMCDDTKTCNNKITNNTENNDQDKCSLAFSTFETRENCEQIRNIDINNKILCSYELKKQKSQKINATGETYDVQKSEHIAQDQSYIRDIEDTETKQCTLTSIMNEYLSDILHEGLLDSILPYMIPKCVQSQPAIRKSVVNANVKNSISLITDIGCNTVSVTSSQKERDKEKNKLVKKQTENEVEIHVYDKDKNIKKNFRCPQKLLIQKMCYFADVTTGQKLEEIDISVHCDVVVFDWLMRWVKKDIIKKSEWPVLEASNVIPIMVSASFLQMEPLLESCLQYCHDNMSDILKTSTILTCLDDALFTRLAELFTNEEAEMLKDKKDKIQSRLFCKLIVSLAETTPDNNKGHYSSLATLFKCGKCGKNVIQSISNHVSCIPSAMKIDNKGILHSKHTRDLSWTLNEYILTLRSELRSWRKVYWRLWGDCHFLFCQQCHKYFPIQQIDWCYYHPESAQFFINEQQRPVPFPLGRYPCCSQRAYRFETLQNQEGCRYKEHLADIRTEKDVNMLNIFMAHRELISIEPPQLFFPEKITRLIAPDPSLRPGKLMCKEIMWWNGIELIPLRPKLGLLGKIWGGPGVRRPVQQQDLLKSQKLYRQISVTTDISSPSSSITDTEEDDVESGSDSSINEESCSDESDAWSTLQSINKTKKKLKDQIFLRNGRCWSTDLMVRYNQDNQREFEEKAAIQMTMLLTKRTSRQCTLSSKSYSKQYGNGKNNRLMGGTYIKLEAEFREQLAQSCRYKPSMTGKSRVKSSKS